LQKRYPGGVEATLSCSNNCPYKLSQEDSMNTALRANNNNKNNNTTICKAP